MIRGDWWINRESDGDKLKIIEAYISEMQRILDKSPVENIRKCIDLVLLTYNQNGQIFVMGNGGSAATASHIANDLGKGTAHLGHRLRVISLTDNVSTMTAWSNDACYEDVFVEQLKGLANPGDLVIGISASGNSENVLRAIRHANAIRCKTIGWTGFGGGQLAEITDISVIVDSHEYGPVEDVHLMLNHILCQSLCEEFLKVFKTREARMLDGSAHT